MKKVIALVCSFIFLGSNTEIHQFINLPELTNHYIHHKSEDSRISFFYFLAIHYSSNHPSDNDDKEDSRLPLKSATNITHTDVLILATKKSNIQANYIFINRPYQTLSVIIPYRTLQGIFHPPKFG